MNRKAKDAARGTLIKIFEEVEKISICENNESQNFGKRKI